MSHHRFACLAVSLLSGLLLTGGVVGAGYAAGAAPVPPAAPAAAHVYPGCAATLQACIDAANPGDVISITAGTYTQSLTLHKSLSLVGAGANQTVLVAQPHQRVLTAIFTTTTNQSVSLSGLTITGGNVLTTSDPVYGSAGAGVLAVLFGSLTVDGVTFRDNQALLNGGGLTAYSNDLNHALWMTVTNSLFDDNGGGGLAANSPLVSATVSNSQFLDNGGDGLDGMAYTNVASSQFTRNSGAGASIGAGQVSASRFERNGGGGLNALADVAVTNTDFLSNTAFFGAGLQADGRAVVSGGRFQGNHALWQGGAAYLGQGGVISGVLAVDNVASDGGAFFFSNLSENALVTGSLLSGNAVTTTTGTAGIVFGYARVPTQTQDLLANTIITGPGTPASRGLQVGLGRSLQQSGDSLSGFAVPQVDLGQPAPPLASPSLVTTTSPGPCPTFITYTHDITVYYGSLTANGAPVFEMASASSKLNIGALDVALFSGRSLRVVQDLVPWTDFGLVDIAWGTAPDDHQDAEQNLRRALAAAWRPASYPAIHFNPPVARGTDSLPIATFDDDYQCGGPAAVHTRNNIVIARLTFIELDATAVIPTYVPVVHR